MNANETIILRLAQCAATALVTYYGASLAQTVCHRLFGHTRRISKLYEVHVAGHHAQYSGSRMLSDEWIPTEQHTIWYYAIPFGPIALAVLWLLPIEIFATHILALSFSIWWHIYLHRQYHVRRSWLRRFGWFQRKRRLHFIHHRLGVKNYAIVEYVWDRLLGTFASSRPTRL